MPVKGGIIISSSCQSRRREATVGAGADQRPSTAAQTQSTLQSLKNQQLVDQQRAPASQASLTLTVKGKESQLDALRESLLAVEANLQKLQAESANTKDLQHQVQSLHAERSEHEAHNKLKQQHAAALTEAAGTSNSLKAAVKAKFADLKTAAQALSAKDTELQQAEASLKEAQDKK